MSLLEKDVFFFTTFGGEALSLAAAKATLLEMQSRPVLQHMAVQGRKLREGYEMIARDVGMRFTSCQGYDARSIVQFDSAKVDPLLAKSFVQQEMLTHGVLWSGFHNLSYAHADMDVKIVLDAYCEILPRLNELVRSGNLGSALRGEPLLPAFRKTANFHTRRRSTFEQSA
jgi:glutamate-1-semialdehyde aminotransferase